MILLRIIKKPFQANPFFRLRFRSHPLGHFVRLVFQREPLTQFDPAYVTQLILFHKEIQMPLLNQHSDFGYNKYRNPTMFNCCTNFEVPVWSQFDGLEIAPVRDDGNGTSEPSDDYEATFYTVYGHFSEDSSVGGGVEAITDVSTRKLADTVARAMVQLASEQGVTFKHGILHF